jgi:hypothetical protein
MPGRLYKFFLSDGRKIVLRFDGFGAHLRQIWIEPGSGSEVNPLPPYVSVEPA